VSVASYLGQVARPRGTENTLSHPGVASLHRLTEELSLAEISELKPVSADYGLSRLCRRLAAGSVRFVLESQEYTTEPAARAPVIDAHTHIFCWGENPADGYISHVQRRALMTRLLLWLTKLRQEPGEDYSAKLRHRLIRQLRQSALDYAIVLAQDAVYRPDGSRDDANTHFYVSNDYVFRLAEQCPKILPGPSINPWRSDALAELERCHAAGARLVKIHTAIQGVDPACGRFDPFYRRAVELGMILMFHTGYEHTCRVISQEFTDPARLARPLDHGLTVIAAHCGTCAFFDAEDYYPHFVRMMHKYPRLYGDTAVLATSIRWFALRRLSREPESLRRRILHGSDYPLPPARLPFLLRTGLFPPERRNPLDMDLRIKRAYDIGPGYERRIAHLLESAQP
jgi:predicted TIM-barrel fold metal-dependent hydrolase